LNGEALRITRSWGEASDGENRQKLPLENLKSDGCLRENKQGKFIKEVLENPQKNGLSFDLRNMGLKLSGCAATDAILGNWEIASNFSIARTLQTT